MAKRLKKESDIDIIQRNFTIRARKAFVKLGVNTLHGLTKVQEKALLSQKGVGKDTVKRIKETIKELGLKYQNRIYHG